MTKNNTIKNGLYIDGGTKRWYLNGELHRVDGHALEDNDGYKAWYINGERHREDGPALERVNGTKEWFLNGEKVYSKYKNNLHKYPNLSESFKKSIIKYKLST
jgi:hypothetical protein